MRFARRAYLSLLLTCAVFGTACAQPSFTFLHITDTHVTPAGNDGPVRELVREMSRGADRPAFVINTGDVTELGLESEFARYLDAVKDSPVPFYSVPGNHDVRWAPLGKRAFEKALGKPYRSFDHGGCHFVLLDTSVTLQHWGHFDRAMLRWLEADLRKVRKGTPIFVAFHHWIGREPPKTDNEAELLELLAPHNVVAILVGHGHGDLAWRVNGIQCVMARGLYQGSYHRVEVGQERIRILRVRKEDAGKPPIVVADLPRAATPRRTIGFAWDDPQLPFLKRRRLLAELRVDGKQFSDDRIRCEYAVNGGSFTTMEVDKRDKKGLSFIGEFETEKLGDGIHRVVIRLTAPDGEVFTRVEPFRVERLEGRPRRAWDDAYQTGDTIQSNPVLAGDVLYVSSFDGRLHALDPRSSRKRWTSDAKGPLYGSPAVQEGMVYVASTDGSLYAFDTRNGRQRWSFAAGDPLFATPAVGDGVVCIGGNRRIFGLDAATGKRMWEVETGGFFQSRAAYAEGAFFLGGWDNTLYAVDARSGTLRWKVQMGRSQGGRGQLMFYFSPAITSPAVADGLLYICTNDGVLHALETTTGREVWQARAPSGGDTFGYSSPLVLSGKVLLGGLGEKGQGDCYALDARTGRLLWRRQTGADNYDSSPALAGRWVVIGSVEGKITWLDPDTGEVKGQYGLDTAFCFSTAAGDGERVYMPTMSGRVYAVSHP